MILGIFPLFYTQNINNLIIDIILCLSY
jgi:hypothetical protein